MKQEILVTADPWQTRIAVLEDGRLMEFFQEPRHLEGLVGNLYLGRASRILPGMASAFVDIGLDRDGFLFEGDMGPVAELDDEDDGSPAPSRAVTVKELREGEPILVQVTKEPMGSKGARLTTQISVPGHYLIYMPHTEHVGVSRKISGPERARLKATVREVKGSSPGAFIVRTAAEGVPAEDLAAEMQSLVDLWALVRLRSARMTAPSLVHQEADLVGRTVREILLKGEGVVVTDDAETARRCQTLLASLGQDPGRVQEWAEKRVTLFEHHRVEQELEKALQARVWLPSGGCIVVQSTEALVSIDVNSGRFVGKKSLEETAFLINCEAAEEVVRQLRLRSLGGIIVIDFIDMSKKAHRDALVARLQSALQSDRSRSRILAISEFGLVEMTRKRTHKSLERVMTATCPCCEGRGRVVAPWRTAQLILQSVGNLRKPVRALVTAPPEVVKYLEENRERLDLPPGLKLEAAPLPRAARYDIRPL